VRYVFHIDVNSAFLSWTAKKMLLKGSDIDLRDIPSAIGGDETSRRGIVLASSIPAKKFGIKTGESLYNARKKCPELRVERADFFTYEQESRKMVELLYEYSPNIKRFSIDECFMDFDTQYSRFKSGEECAKEISKRIKNELGFTVNIGISTNKLLAKMASDFEKPDKIHTLYPEEIKEKMWPLPVEDLYLVGRASRKKLNDKGIFTIGDLANTHPEILKKMLKSHGLTLHEYANGIESSPIANDEDIKGIGNSTTLPYDTNDMDYLKTVLLSLSESVAQRLRRHNKTANTICVEIKTFDFKHTSCQRKTDSAICDTTKIYKIACKLLSELMTDTKIRLLGLRVTGFENECIQLSFEDIGTKKSIDPAIDKLREKYGNNIITPLSLLNTDFTNILDRKSDKIHTMKSKL